MISFFSLYATRKQIAIAQQNDWRRSFGLVEKKQLRSGKKICKNFYRKKSDVTTSTTPKDGCHAFNCTSMREENLDEMKLNTLSHKKTKTFLKQREILPFEIFALLQNKKVSTVK